MISIDRIKLKMRLYREAAQIGQKMTAKKLNLGYRSYQRIETEGSDCSVSFLCNFCNLFNADFDRLVSPNAPKINDSLIFFNDKNEIAKFESIEIIKNSNLAGFGNQLISGTLFQRGFAKGFNHSSPIVVNYDLCISTPFKYIYYNSKEEYFDFQSKKGTNAMMLEEKINYWDCIYYYRPQYSIKQSSFTDKLGERMNFTLYSMHLYQKDELSNISLVEYN